MTLGELGVGNLQQADPNFVKQVRQNEFNRAMDKKGFDYQILNYPDLELSFVDLRELSFRILEIIRQVNPAAIFSFAPDEYTWMFDHPDHTVSGQATRIAATGADISEFAQQFEAIEQRPELYWRITDPKRASHKLSLSKKLRKKRNAYLINNYPSQFSHDDEQDWSQIFDRINKKKKDSKKQREYYLRVR